MADDVNIKLPPDVLRMLNGGLPPHIALAIGEVVSVSTGANGLFARHFRQGQSEWPSLAPSTLGDKRKTDKQKFKRLGGVYKAITQPGLGGRLESYGSSADMVAGGSLDMLYSQNGLYVRFTARPGGLGLRVGFVGRYKQGAAYKKLRNAYGSNRAVMARMQKQLRISKHDVAGSRGYVRVRAAGKGRSGKKMLLARGNENLAYANILQRGVFLGLRSKDTGQLFNPRAAASRRFKKAAKLGGMKFAAVFSEKKFPLLPAKQADLAPIRDAFERGMARGLAKSGWPTRIV